MPASRGGGDFASNIQAACAGCNLQKGNKTSPEYILWRLMNPQLANFGPF